MIQEYLDGEYLDAPYAERDSIRPDGHSESAGLLSAPPAARSRHGFVLS
jgi:hypothetical protein